MTRRTRSPRSARPLALAALLTALLLTGCAGGAEDTASSDAASSDADGGAAGAVGAPEEAAASEGETFAYDAGGADRAAASSTAASPLVPAERAVVSTGTVAVRADDVAAARAEVQQVVDELRGEVADERTGTDGEGEVVRSRVVVRVPVASFDEAMVRLSAVGELDRATRSSEDVTTQVVDVAARVRAQEKSLARVEALLAEASDLREVIAVEAQLTRRQADLDALKAQQAYLADATSLSTITVSVELPREDEPAAEDDEGFHAGLATGWDALGEAAVASLTVLGAVLPFAAVGLLVGAPLLLTARRRARTR